MSDGMPDESRTPLIGERQSAGPVSGIPRTAPRWQPQRRLPTCWTCLIAGTCAVVAVQIVICIDGQIDFRALGPRFTSHSVLASSPGTGPERSVVTFAGRDALRPGEATEEAGRFHVKGSSGAAIAISDTREEGAVPSQQEKTQCAAMLSAAATARRHTSPANGIDKSPSVVTPSRGSPARPSSRDNLLRALERGGNAMAAQSGYMDGCRLLIGLILMGASEREFLSRVPGFLGPPLLRRYRSPGSPADPATSE